MEWKKGQEALKASKKYKMSQDGAVAKLIIHELDEEDAGDYTCVCGDQQTTATLTVNGKTNKLYFVFYLFHCHLQRRHGCDS